MRSILLFLALLASTLAYAQTGVDLKLTQKGYYKVKKLDGTVFPENYSALNTAETRAMQEALTCGCEIRIVPPEISVIMSVVTSTTPPATGPAVVQFSWTIPATRTNGAVLPPSELAKFELYLTSGSTTLPVVTVPMPGVATSLTLAPGNYSAAISAFDTAGLKSPLSTVVTFDIP